MLDYCMEGNGGGIKIQVSQFLSIWDEASDEVSSLRRWDKKNYPQYTSKPVLNSKDVHILTHIEDML